MSPPRVQLVQCGPYANESERRASAVLKVKLIGEPETGPHILLTNLTHSSDPRRLSDEIDLVDISSGGVVVIEVKHWDASHLDTYPDIAEREAEKLNAKVRRIAGTLRKRYGDIGFVEGRLLLTRGEGMRFSEPGGRRKVSGIPVYGLVEWRDLVGTSGTHLDEATREGISRLLEPTSSFSLSGDLRSFAGIVNLERLSPPDDRFHRVYRGIQQTRRDKVELHLFDLSASEHKNPLDQAEREFAVLQRLQKSPFLPRLLDSFQQASDYPGELYFYSIMDPLAPSLRERAQDDAWTTPERLAFAVRCLEALEYLHSPTDPADPSIVHRRLNPQTVRVRQDGQPLFTRLEIAKLQGSATVSTRSLPSLSEEELDFLAPEVHLGGSAAGDAQSDVFALCASLEILFRGRGADAVAVMPILGMGQSANPAERATLEEIRARLSALLGGVSKPVPVPDEPPLLAARFWDEETVVPFQESRYRVINRLGSGGMGITFKVLDTGASGHEEYGGYVGKVIAHAEDGEAALHAYRRVRTHTHSNLAVIFEIAPRWVENSFVALLKWVDGQPLKDLIGLITLHAEEVGEEPQTLALRWLRELCSGLATLHRAGLVHGDVSPANVIVSGSTVTLTDFDTVIGAGEVPRAANDRYSAAQVQNRIAVNPSDDVFALAASLFEVLFEAEPFRFDGVIHKNRGLNWPVGGKEIWPKLVPFFERATYSQDGQRFSSALEALAALEEMSRDPEEASPLAGTGKGVVDALVPHTPNVVPRLLDLLRSYPGSLHGNAETRGLDSDFAESTYVDTGLDEDLAQDIVERRVSLVILFGNAGDGKTAFLQNLAVKLGLPRQHSAERLWDHTLPNGVRVRANLDGSASFRGRSATELLDEFFAPFDKGDAGKSDSTAFPTGLVHLVAVNSGPLKAWIEHHEGALRVPSHLTGQLRAALEGDLEALDPGFRFLDLNARSLVGGTDLEAGAVRTEFLNELLTKMLGSKMLGREQENPWTPCFTCTAQDRCTAWGSVRLLLDAEAGPVIKRRTFEALQAVHQRGEIHITARELRAGLSYVFFGLHHCSDLHENPELMPEPFSQRAFAPDSPNRQGEVLTELALLDPALDAHPRVDRRLLKLSEAGPEGVTGFRGRSLAEARRLAYFLWSDAEVREVGGNTDALSLAGGRHLALFRQVPFLTSDESQALCAELCEGISRLEALPEVAFLRLGGVPLKIVPRTPTESAFWVEKPLERFTLEASQAVVAEGLEALHTRLVLSYHYALGRQERLFMGAGLFHVLLELREGVQLSGEASEGIFANLAIFTQRLAQEDSRELYAWNPLEEDAVFRLRAELRDGVQVMVNERIDGVV